MKNKKLMIDVHKFIDIHGDNVPIELVKKLDRNCLYIYEDTNSLKEHLYGIDTLNDKMSEKPKFFSLEEKVMINRIARVCHKNDVGYFRFVFTHTVSPF